MGFGVEDATRDDNTSLPPRPDDEIGHYFRGRRLCAMDAVWRLLGFQTYPSSVPAVLAIKVRTEEFVELYAKDFKKYTDIEIYMKRQYNADLWELSKNLTYKEFFSQFVYGYSPPTRAYLVGNNGAHHFIIVDTRTKKRPDVHVTKRSASRAAVVVRLTSVSRRSGELWYLRLILKNRAVSSFADCYKQWDIETNDYFRDQEGEIVTHPTFQLAAVHNLYVESGKEECLTAFSISALEDNDKPSALRLLFVTMTVNGFPTLAIKLRKDLWRCMYERQEGRDPRQEELSLSESNRLEQELLTRLSDLLQAQNLTMEQFGLPSPDKMNTELERYALNFPMNEQLQKLKDLQLLAPLNHEQAAVFDSFMTIIRNQGPNDDCRFLLLEGDGGTGKSLLLKHIVYAVRSSK
jgi:hypothetical protein